MPKFLWNLVKIKNVFNINDWNLNKIYQLPSTLSERDPNPALEESTINELDLLVNAFSSPFPSHFTFSEIIIKRIKFPRSKQN